MGKPKPSIIWKMSDRRVKQSEIWVSGVSIQCTQGTFDTSVIKVILGSFGVFLIFKNLVSRKRQGFRVKDISRSLCYPVYVVIVFHLVNQSAKPLGFLFFFM